MRRNYLGELRVLTHYINKKTDCIHTAERVNGEECFKNDDKYKGIIDPYVKGYIYRNNFPDTMMKPDYNITDSFKTLIYNLMPLKINKIILPIYIDELEISNKLKKIIIKTIEGASLTLRNIDECDKTHAELKVNNGYCIAWFSSPFNCLSTILTNLMTILKHLQNIIIDFNDNDKEITDDEKEELTKIYKVYTDDDGQFNYLENLYYHNSVVSVKLENINDNLY
jgi:hypothetical protein